MKIISFGIVLLIGTSCQHGVVNEKKPTLYRAELQAGADWRSDRSPAQEAVRTVRPKDYFKNVSQQERDEYLARAEIFVPTYDPAAVAQMNLVSDLAGACGDPYGFRHVRLVDERQREVAITYLWNEVGCNYRPDTEKKMSGGSPKFLCDFDGPDGITTEKVKYAYQDQQPLEHGSEVIETMLGFNLARLMGFHTNIYCPAVLNCVGCSSAHPWEDNRAQGRVSRNTYKKQYAIVEQSIDAYKVSVPTTANAPNGVDYNEIGNTSGENESERRRRLIEREAWMLWVHFIQHTDAGHFNNRLGCAEYREDGPGRYHCTKPILYTHDYGHSFHFHMSYDRWAAIPALIPAGENGCRGGLTPERLPRKSFFKRRNAPGNPVILNAVISSEARDVFVERMSRISDDQWIMLFQLARGEEAVKKKSAEWLQVIKRKIAEMRAAPCLPFDSGKSVLGRR